MTQSGEHDGAPRIPVVYGEPVQLVGEIDETFGVPTEAAQVVSRQILRALEEAGIEPESVLFSGYDDYDYGGATTKENGRFANVGTSDDDTAVHEYFLGNADYLADGQGGPLAYAATGTSPVVGVYPTVAIEQLGYDHNTDSVTATPEQMREAMILEFHPRYEREEEDEI